MYFQKTTTTKKKKKNGNGDRVKTLWLISAYRSTHFTM